MESRGILFFFFPEVPISLPFVPVGSSFFFWGSFHFCLVNFLLCLHGNQVRYQKWVHTRLDYCPSRRPLLPLLPSTLGLTPLTLHGNNCFDFYFLSVIGWHVTQSILFPPLFGVGGGSHVFQNRKPADFHGKNKKNMVPSTYSIKALSSSVVNRLWGPA